MQGSPPSTTPAYEPVPEVEYDEKKEPALSVILKPGFAKLRANTSELLWIVSTRVFTIFLIVGCLALGYRRQVFGLKEQIFVVSFLANTIELSVDIQLAVFGLVNKLLDILVQDALVHIAGITLTTWMARSAIGARTLDFQMQDELTKPWITVLNYYKRIRILGWAGVGLWGTLRYLASFAIAVSVILLGASINTIGFPKDRWKYSPELWTDRFRINATEWNGMNNIAYNMGLTWAGMENRAWSLIAADCWAATSGLWASAGLAEGWISVYQDNYGSWNNTAWSWTDAEKITGLRVDNSTSGTVFSISIHGDVVTQMWVTQTEIGSTDARYSSGWTGDFNLTLPIGIVSCTPGNTPNTTNETISVTGPDLSQGPATISIVLGNSTAQSFGGATCNFTLRQGQFMVKSWIIDGDEADVSIDDYGSDKNRSFTLNEISPEDLQIADKVSTLFRNIIPTMDALSQPGGLVQHILTVGQNLVNAPGLANHTVNGIEPVIATIIQHMITMAEWTMVPVAEPGKDMVLSTSIQYSVYGSGPRLPWQWAIGTVLVIALLMLVYDLGITLWWRVQIGLWLSIPGMMLTANKSESMSSIKYGSLGAETDEVKRTAYFVRKVGSNYPQLTDDPNSGEILPRDELFG
ncbi:hypothetical protein RUND412_000955 [Rhizina undulata]